MSNAEVALRIFLIVVLGASLSGLVAFLGNKLGRHVGRRKMSLFGLRPKYTSNVITVATGCVIFVATLAIMSAASWEVREVLVGLEGLRQEAADLRKEIADQRKIFDAGPTEAPMKMLSVGVVLCGLSKKETREQIDLLLELANENVLTKDNEVASKNNLPPLSDDTKLVGYVEDDKERIISKLTNIPKGETLVVAILTGQKTAYYNDKIEAQFLFRPNSVVFTKNQMIVSGLIDGRGTSVQVYKDIVAFIFKDLQFTCIVQHEMIRNPATDKFDTSISFGMMQRAAEEIARARRLMKLEVVANAEIHPLGPLDARLVVMPP